MVTPEEAKPFVELISNQAALVEKSKFEKQLVIVMEEINERKARDSD